MAAEWEEKLQQTNLVSPGTKFIINLYVSYRAYLIIQYKGKHPAIQLQISLFGNIPLVSKKNKEDMYALLKATSHFFLDDWSKVMKKCNSVLLK